MDPSGRDGIARAVERLEHHHAVGVADIAIAQNAQAGSGQRDDCGIAREKTNDGRGKEQKEDPNAAEEKHVVEAGTPDGGFRAVRLLGYEILPDQGGGGVAQAPAWQENENENADGDGVAGQHRRAEDAGDAHEADPTRMCDHKLKNAGQRNAQQPQQHLKVDAELAAQNMNALGPLQKAVELIEHADAASGKRGERCAGDAELRKWAPTENETGVEDQIDDV